jgi:catechol 2,3-dioxygenase-like lactoylglutathione lyase family enzyme
MRCLLDHIVLNVRDVDAMLAFYVDVLELQGERIDEYRRGVVPFPSVRLNSDTVVDFFPRRLWQHADLPGPGRHNLNHLCLALTQAEWHAFGERLRRRGVVITAGPVSRWGAHGTGTSIYFDDPEGNQVEVRYYEGHSEGEKCLLGS